MKRGKDTWMKLRVKIMTKVKRMMRMKRMWKSLTEADQTHIAKMTQMMSEMSL